MCSEYKVDSRLPVYDVIKKVKCQVCKHQSIEHVYKVTYKNGGTDRVWNLDAGCECVSML